jgi:putative Holliday junction resolvase
LEEVRSGVVEGRILGLDVGERWIGVALSDPLGILASPLTRLERTDDEAAVKAIADLVRKHEAKAVVAGLPYSLDGNVGPQAVRVRDFLRKLAQSLSVPVQTSDERLSTVTAMQGMIEAGASRESRKGKIDAAAAALILQWYLDRLRREQTESQDQSPAMGTG